MNIELLDVLIVTSFLLALYFPVMFFLRSHPNANSPGRAQFGFSIVVTLIMGLAMIRSVFDIMLPAWARIVVYAMITGGLLAQAITLTKTQNRRSRRLAQEQNKHEEITT